MLSAGCSEDLYCGKECQVAAWKGGYKSACSNMRNTVLKKPAPTRELRAARHHLRKRQPCRHAPPDGVADGALLAGVPLQLAMEPSDRAAQDIREKPGCTGCGAIRGGQWLLL
jgi:hypothetical protein